MNPSYRRDKDHNYMVLDAPGTLQGTEYQIRMIVGNQISHVLKCHMRMIDGKAVFFYEITGKQPLFRTFEKTAMNREDIQRILLGIKRALENTERYLLDASQLLFEPEYLFEDIQTREIYLCYLPSFEGDMAEGFRRLAEYILKKLDHSDEQAVLLGYDVYSRTTEENYRLSEVLQIVYQNRRKDSEKQEEQEEECFEEEREDTESTDAEEAEKNECCTDRANGDDLLNRRPKRSTKAGTEDLTDKILNVKKKERQPWFAGWKKWAGCILGSIAVLGMAVFLVYKDMLNIVQAGGLLFLAAGIFIYFGSLRQQEKEDVCRDEEKISGRLRIWNRKKGKWKQPDFDKEMETFVIREGEEIHIAVLVSVKPEKYENILLYKEEMHIGKEERRADACIPSDVVSRVHAKIVRRDGSYYITDLNSTNGTFLNGRRIAPEETLALEQGDMIAFATAEYIFQIP